MKNDFYKPIKHTNIFKANDIPNESKIPAIRVYCEQSQSSWLLQVRGKLELKNGNLGKDFVIAGAYLDREKLEELRDNITILLENE